MLRWAGALLWLSRRELLFPDMLKGHALSTGKDRELTYTAQRVAWVRQGKGELRVRKPRSLS